MTTYQDLISKMPLFAGIPSEMIPGLLKKLGARQVSYPEETYIRSRGDKADFIGIVLSGSVHILKDDYKGNRSITASLGPGSLFAEAFACAGIPTLPVDILSAEDSDILFLRKAAFFGEDGSRLEERGLLLSNLLRISARKNIYLNKKLSCLSCRTTREKLLTYLNDQARQAGREAFTIPFDRQGLADYLCVERSAMSAEIGKLQREGVLETKKNHFRLLKDPKAKSLYL